MATYQDHIDILKNLHDYGVQFGSFNIKELNALNAGIEALMTLQDMGTYMNKILNNRYKGEDNKP